MSVNADRWEVAQMLDNKRIADFIAGKRKEAGMTQAEVAESLQVSFQAVSKWENGTLPNVEKFSALFSRPARISSTVTCRRPAWIFPIRTP